MKFLNYHIFILSICKIFNLTETEINSIYYKIILKYFVNSISTLEPQKMKLKNNIEDNSRIYSQEYINKRQELQQIELVLRKKIIKNNNMVNINKKTSILSSRPSLSILSYQNKLINTCNEIVKYLSVKKIDIEKEKVSYIELCNVLNNLFNIRSLETIINQIELVDGNSFVFFIDNLAIIISARGILCIYLLENEDIIDIKNKLSILFKNVLMDSIDKFLHLYNINEYFSFNEISYCLEERELELLENYCSKLINLTKGNINYEWRY